MRIPFAKLHGLGNDFIVSCADHWSMAGHKPAGIEARGRGPQGDRFLFDLARAICERHTGIGADGFLLVLAPDDREDDARVRFFNADGSEAEISGNGIRCVGVFLRKLGRRKRRLKIETLAGVKTLDCVKAGERAWEFRVGMGNPILEPEKIPFEGTVAAAGVIGFPLRTKHGAQRVTVTSMGNPHCSLFVKDFLRTDWQALGSEIETHRLFPNRTNVEFVRVISRGEIEVRYWERGVGVTASSGTGSCAAVVASILNGYTRRHVRVRTIAGNLLVEWPQGGEVLLTGPAQWIAEGAYWQPDSRSPA